MKAYSFSFVGKFEERASILESKGDYPNILEIKAAKKEENFLCLNYLSWLLFVDQIS